MAEPITHGQLNSITFDQAKVLHQLLRTATPASPPFFQEYLFTEQIRLAVFFTLALYGSQEVISFLEKNLGEMAEINETLSRRVQPRARAQIMERVKQLREVADEIVSLYRWGFALEVDYQVLNLAIEARHAALQLEMR